MPNSNSNYSAPELPDDDEEDAIVTTPEELEDLIKQRIISIPGETSAITVEHIMSIWLTFTGIIISLLFLGFAFKPLSIFASPYMLLTLGIFDTGNTVYRWHVVKAATIRAIVKIFQICIPACSMMGCIILSINNFLHRNIALKFYTFNSIAGPIFFIFFFAILATLSFRDAFQNRMHNSLLSAIKGIAATLGISVVLFGFLLPAICKAAGIMAIVKSMASQSTTIFALGALAVIIILTITTYQNREKIREFFVRTGIVT